VETTASSYGQPRDGDDDDDGDDEFEVMTAGLHGG